MKQCLRADEFKYYFSFEYFEFLSIESVSNHEILVLKCYFKSNRTRMSTMGRSMVAPLLEKSKQRYFVFFFFACFSSTTT